ncbi:MAG TPA: rod-binding protein [Humidesulfovibrio sp.]|uniref:rod-binding protein n=1 Tax=Humidesulfovibrio sp. TaxID=2910988 RepID=UPI002C63BBF2|nr:rod-binding protein [Humidesulfovibrio sp.]HWR04753.1 rod-binding protein [Humidesulfovibrio sp.]
MADIAAQDAALAAKKAQDSELTALKQQMDRLKGDITPGPSAKQKLRKACTDFEAVFISKMWEQMRATIPKGGMFQSPQEEMYRSMFDREFTEKMAQDGGIGLGDMLYSQLQGKIKGGGKAAGKTGAQALQPVTGDISANQPSGALSQPASTGAVPEKKDFKTPRRGNALGPQAASSAASTATATVSAQAKAASQTSSAAPSVAAAPKVPASVPGAVMADVEALARRIEADYDRRQAESAGQTSGQASIQAAAAGDPQVQDPQPAQRQAQSRVSGYGLKARENSIVAGRRFATIG